MSVDLPVNALLRAAHDTGVIKYFGPGMYSLVSFCQILPGVSVYASFL
jgi:hypothetical protein